MFAIQQDFTEAATFAETPKQAEIREFREYAASMCLELGRKALSLNLKFLAYLLMMAADDAGSKNVQRLG